MSPFEQCQSVQSKLSKCQLSQSWDSDIDPDVMFEYDDDSDPGGWSSDEDAAPESDCDSVHDAAGTDEPSQSEDLFNFGKRLISLPKASSALSKQLTVLPAFTAGENTHRSLRPWKSGYSVSQIKISKDPQSPPTSGHLIVRSPPNSGFSRRYSSTHHHPLGSPPLTQTHPRSIRPRPITVNGTVYPSHSEKLQVPIDPPNPDDPERFEIKKPECEETGWRSKITTRYCSFDGSEARKAREYLNPPRSIY